MRFLFGSMAGAVDVQGILYKHDKVLEEDILGRLYEVALIQTYTQVMNSALRNWNILTVWVDC